MLAKKTLTNQITLPKEVVELFPSTSYFDVRVEGGEIILRPAEVSRRSGDEVRSKLQALGIGEEDVRNAVRWARDKRR